MGLPGYKIRDVTLENIEIVYPGRGDSLYAKCGLTPQELDGIPEMEKSYPEFSQFKELPAWGFYIRHAEGVTFRNITLRASAPDYRPAVVTHDVRGVTLQNVRINEPGSDGKQQVFHYQTSNIINEDSK